TMSQTMQTATRRTPIAYDYPLSDPVTDEELNILLIVNGCVLLGLLSAFGSICNVINIVVFLRMGFKDTINISLFCIAVDDTGALITLIWGTICLNPLMIHKFEDLEMSEINYVTSAWPHSYFVRVTGFTTCVVTIERYICIAYPLKVRNIVTSRRTVIINISLFVILSAGIVPLFASTYAVVRASISKNRTVTGLITKEALVIENYVRYSNNILRPITFIIVLFMTILLIYRLKRTAEWRNSTATNSKQGTISKRDHKVVVMVLFISIFFIVCYFPIFVNFFG
ncbi:unnamed protein product, partial [Candidula unifasciata]